MPRFDSGASSNSPPGHAGLRQWSSSRGKCTDRHPEQRVPSSRKSSSAVSSVNQPATTGVRVRDKAPPGN